MHDLLQKYFSASLLYAELHAKVTDELKQFNLTPQQAVALSSLNNGPMTCSELAYIMRLSLPMVTYLSKSLDRQGYIKKEKAKSDKKMRILTITDKGKSIIDGG